MTRLCAATAAKTFDATEITVTKAGVYGSGGDIKYRRIIPFELTYDQIRKVSTLNTVLIITTTEKSIYLNIEENAQQIEGMIDELKESSGSPQR